MLSLTCMCRSRTPLQQPANGCLCLSVFLSQLHGCLQAMELQQLLRLPLPLVSYAPCSRIKLHETPAATAMPDHRHKPKRCIVGCMSQPGGQSSCRAAAKCLMQLIQRHASPACELISAAGMQDLHEPVPQLLHLQRQPARCPHPFAHHACWQHLHQRQSHLSKSKSTALTSQGLQACSTF